MEVTETALPGVLKLTPKRFGDARGYFSETWSLIRTSPLGVGDPHPFVQDNHSASARAGTVRGLHYQRPPCAQGKLVRVARGAVIDVAVDARRGSPHYGRWVAVELSELNGAMLWVPRGFLHGFATLQDDTHVIYKVDAPYAPDCDGAVRFDDPDLAIDWGVDPAAAILSDKDAAAPNFRDFETPFVHESS